MGLIMSVNPGSQDGPAGRRRAQAAAFDQIGGRYDEAFPHKQGQVAAASWLIGQLGPGARVLDAGCGTGVPTARQLAEAGLDVTGIDISPVMLAWPARTCRWPRSPKWTLWTSGPRPGNSMR